MKRFNQLLLLCTIAFAIGIGVKYYMNFNNQDWGRYAIIVSLVIFFIGGISVVVNYLSASDPNYIHRVIERVLKRPSQASIKEFISYNRLLKELKKDKDNVALDILKIQDALYDRVTQNFKDDAIRTIENNYEKLIQKEAIFSTIGSEMEPITNTIIEYLDKVRRNSIVNLLIGIISTVTAIGTLGYSIYTAKPFVEVTPFLLSLIPKMTFAIFIQIFAFFFLRLYKSNLADAKYFQNELTNLMVKKAALKTAYITETKEKFNEILLSLGTTERNFKLAQGESLFNLENAKIEKEADMEILRTWKDMMMKLPGKNNGKDQPE